MVTPTGWGGEEKQQQEKAVPEKKSWLIQRLTSEIFIVYFLWALVLLMIIVALLIASSAWRSSGNLIDKWRPVYDYLSFAAACAAAITAGLGVFLKDGAKDNDRALYSISCMLLLGSIGCYLLAHDFWSLFVAAVVTVFLIVLGSQFAVIAWEGWAAKKTSIEYNVTLTIAVLFLGLVVLISVLSVALALGLL